MIKLVDIAQLRLRNQRLMLSGARFASPEEVVGWFGAVQSQEYAPAKWSLGQRMRDASDSGIEAAIAAGRILRTHVLRPTWHFVLPRDIHAWMRLTAPRWAPFVKARHAQMGVEAADYRRALDSIRLALADGTHLTRQELGAQIARDGVAVDGQRLAFIVMAAETQLVVASGAHRGTVPTYTLLPEVPAAQFDRDAALAELTLRYFTSHGPAMLRDFTWWSSLTVIDARRGIAANPYLEKVNVDGTDYWWAGDSTGGPDDPRPTARLLQGFDEYVVGYRSPRTYLNLDGLGPHTGLNTPSWLHGVFMDGQLIGWWRRTAGKGGAGVETKLFRSLSTREQSALNRATDRYLAFIGRAGS